MYSTYVRRLLTSTFGIHIATVGVHKYIWSTVVSCFGSSPPTSFPLLQCATHVNLGWQIDFSGAPHMMASVLLTLLLSAIASLFATYSSS